MNEGIINEEASVEKGENARMASFVGAIAIADLVKSTLGPDAAADTHPGIGAQNYGIKLTATFACLLLYLWTLVAPYALRDSRDFGIEFDD